MRRMGARVDPDEDDLTVRDRRYESFGEQGVALPTYAVPGHAPALDHAEENIHRGVDGVVLGDALGEATPVSESPAEAGDDRLQHRVVAHLTEDATLDDGELDVIVHHGEVTLGGTVADEEQRRRALVVARSVRGVVEVVDRIRIHKRR